MFLIIKKIFALFTRNEKRQLCWLLVAVVFMAIIEVAGVASIMPFMMVVSNPEIINSNELLNWAYHAFHIDSVTQFLFLLGSLSLSVIIFNNILHLY